MILYDCTADKDDVDGDDDDERIHLDVVDGYHGDNNSFGGSGDEVGVATVNYCIM